MDIHEEGAVNDFGNEEEICAMIGAHEEGDTLEESAQQDGDAQGGSS